MGKVLENNNRLSCWQCGAALEFDMKSATPVIASLPEEERKKMGAALFRALAQAKEEEYPNTAEAIKEPDLKKTKEPWFHVLRESIKEKDAASIAIIAAWFMDEADKQTMTNFIHFMEREPEETPDPPEPGHVLDFPLEAEQ